MVCETKHIKCLLFYACLFHFTFLHFTFSFPFAKNPVLLTAREEIHKYFGSSTPNGLEFQFRSIRKEAKALTEAVERGDDPSTLKTGSVEYRHDKGASSGRGRGRPRGSGSAKGGKGRKAAAGASDDDEEMDDDAETGDPDSSYNSTPTPASKRGGKSANNRVLGSNSRVSKSSPLKKGGSSFGTSSQQAIAVDSDDDDDDDDKGAKVQVKKEFKKPAVPAAVEEDDEDDDDPNEFYGGERDDEDRSGYYNLPAGFTAASHQRSFKMEADEEFDDLV